MIGRITRNNESDSEARWIINEKGVPEKWYVDNIGRYYTTLRKTKEKNPNAKRIMTYNQFAYKTEQEALETGKRGMMSKI